MFLNQVYQPEIESLWSERDFRLKKKNRIYFCLILFFCFQASVISPLDSGGSHGNNTSVHYVGYMLDVRCLFPFYLSDTRQRPDV